MNKKTNSECVIKRCACYNLHNCAFILNSYTMDSFFLCGGMNHSEVNLILIDSFSIEAADHVFVFMLVQ